MGKCDATAIKFNTDSLYKLNAPSFFKQHESATDEIDDPYGMNVPTLSPFGLDLILDLVSVSRTHAGYNKKDSLGSGTLCFIEGVVELN